MSILFYKINEEYGCFSNFAHYDFELDGKKWMTSEHYFQAQKFKGTEYVTDFVVYKEDNWMSIADEDLKNEQMVKEVLTILSQVYDHIVLIVGSGEINTINFLISNFSTTNEQIQAEDNNDTQNIFNKITIRLK